MSATPDIKGFFETATNTITYLVADPATSAAVVIDPVLDYDPASGTVDTRSIEKVLQVIQSRGLKLELVLETHAHADHLSAATYLKAKTGAKIGIGACIRDVQKIFRPMFMADDVKVDGSDFDLLFSDGETFQVGGLTFDVMHTPGHTPADISYKVADNVFVGDTLFMPDYGTARTDFPGGDAHQLFRSIQRLLALPRETKLFLCHDYLPAGRKAHAWETTVGEQIDRNIHLSGGRSEDEFVGLREARDKALATPRLLLPSIQVNIRAGRFPIAETNGVRYLKIPVRVKPHAVDAVT